MNKIFTYEAKERCDGCWNRPLESLPYFAVLTAAGPAAHLNFFFAFKQFCSEECRMGYIEELNDIDGGFLAFGYEVVKGE